MKKYTVYILCITLFVACKLNSENNTSATSTIANNKALAVLFENYYEEELPLNPFNATTQGDSRYNHLLAIEFTNQHRNKLQTLYTKYLNKLLQFNPKELNENDELSYRIFKYTLETNIKSLGFNDNLIPFSQFVGTPLTLGQLGSGSSAQPFNSVTDYYNWLQRATAFAAWADSAIVYFNKGIDAGVVLPKSLVLKMLPQMQSMVAKDVTKSLFYGPIEKMPASFSTLEKKAITDSFITVINKYLQPAYAKLYTYLSTVYLNKARNSSGIGNLPNGEAYYRFLVEQNTTTTKTPNEIYALGISEVKRIKGLMDSVKHAVGFTGSLPAFFEFMKNDKQFMPYKTPKEVLQAFENIHTAIKPQLQLYFKNVPKTAFEIRQTEAFRAATASAEYNQGSPDGKRPGIFYVPILDATQFNTTSGMESLFLHEAIPGHHYQVSLQQEDSSLPKFRRFGFQNAYVEGWALYCESLGKELGLYKDPYQYMGALGDEMHRAIRLVVDVGLHSKNMTREQAIAYMMENEAIAEQGAVAEIERYMAIPGQALGYKIGALKIRELRTKYENELGKQFNIANFHNEVLQYGSMPLSLLENKLAQWAATVKK